MAIPICIEIPAFPEPPALTLPGGLSMQQLNLLDAIQPALAPLMPLFDIIETVVALYNTVKAIPDCLGPPPDPSALLAALPGLAEQIAKLLKLIPPLSLPLTIIGIIDLVLGTLESVRAQLVHVQGQMAIIERSVDRARNLDDAGLLAITACAQANVAQESSNIGKELAGVGRLLGILGLFMGMIGGPEVPDLSGLSGKGLDEVLMPLDALMETLKSVRRAIPVP